jgi:hypothetical protein
LPDHRDGTRRAVSPRVPITTRIIVIFTLAVSLATACSSPDDAPVATPDAPPRVALDPSGTFVVHSMYTLTAPPPDLAPLLAELSRATDDADDPSAYLVNLVVAELPEGTPRTIGSALAPYVAWYVNSRLSAFAPNFVPGVRAMAAGAHRIATRFGTIEEMRIVANDASKTDVSNADAVAPPRTGSVRRTIVGAQFDDVAFAFADVGLPDASTTSKLAVQTFTSDRVPDQLAIERHGVRVPYAAWFRLGFDRAVIPAVVPGATDLASALAVLVDCARLGSLIADALEVGSPLLYAHACTIGLGVGARAIYERFPSASDTQLYALDLAGTATAVDADRDGVMDTITDGAWAGRLDDTAVGAAVFDGMSR